MPKLHLMLDFETLSNTPTSAVLSLGVVLFTKEKMIASEHWIFNPTDQLNAKLDVSFETIAWWMSQADEAKKLFATCLATGVSMNSFLDDFERYIKDYATGYEIIVWSHGANFDIPIFENLLKRGKRKIPWKFYNTRCYRTMKAIHKIEEGKERSGIKHNALDDATFQAGCVMGMFNKIPGSDA
jgi:hypothetical protein